MSPPQSLASSRTSPPRPLLLQQGLCALAALVASSFLGLLLQFVNVFLVLGGLKTGRNILGGGSRHVTGWGAQEHLRLILDGKTTRICASEA